MMYAYRITSLLCFCFSTTASNCVIEETESIKTMNQKEQIKTAGQFIAHDRLGTPVIIEWQKTTIFAPEFAQIMKAVWPMARKAYTAVEIDFLREHPEIVTTEEQSYEGWYKPFEPFFKNGIDAVDWDLVEAMMQKQLKSHFIFDTSTWGPEVTAMFAQDICYGITVKDQQTNTLRGFITFMIRPNYAPGDIKLMTSGVDQTYQNRDLDKLLISSILRINPDVKRICTAIRVTNTTALKKYQSWGFAHTDNPILDHPHNFQHWTFLEYKVEKGNILQKMAESLKGV